MRTELNSTALHHTRTQTRLQEMQGAVPRHTRTETHAHWARLGPKLPVVTHTCTRKGRHTMAARTARAAWATHTITSQGSNLAQAVQRKRRARQMCLMACLDPARAHSAVLRIVSRGGRPWQHAWLTCVGRETRRRTCSRPSYKRTV